MEREKNAVADSFPLFAHALDGVSVGPKPHLASCPKEWVRFVTCSGKPVC